MAPVEEGPDEEDQRRTVRCGCGGVAQASGLSPTPSGMTRIRDAVNPEVPHDLVAGERRERQHDGCPAGSEAA